MFVTIAWSAGATSANWPVVPGALEGAESRGGVVDDESTVPKTWNSQNEYP
ncbi:hypothetical protein LUX57_08605 [Actinomadura madurae]|uniref:hypothetical protein n=1 Tax=Actinomadura madurae TaxID=1993 RepID=UPI0020D23E35|nr:hypothetical protein [Actinomadura madurae]MCP9965189.1 hypothetical protein [Actinomadura madurae]